MMLGGREVLRDGSSFLNGRSGKSFNFKDDMLDDFACLFGWVLCFTSKIKGFALFFVLA
jgi:hypothetical protein